MPRWKLRHEGSWLGMFQGTTCDLCCRPQHEDSTASWSTPLGRLVICIPCNWALMDRLEADLAVDLPRFYDSGSRSRYTE